jgi:hypothetical protein
MMVSSSRIIGTRRWKRGSTGCVQAQRNWSDVSGKHVFPFQRRVAPSMEIRFGSIWAARLQCVRSEHIIGAVPARRVEKLLGATLAPQNGIAETAFFLELFCCLAWDIGRVLRIQAWFRLGCRGGSSGFVPRSRRVARSE